VLWPLNMVPFLHARFAVQAVRARLSETASQLARASADLEAARRDADEAERTARAQLAEAEQRGDALAEEVGKSEEGGERHASQLVSSV